MDDAVGADAVHAVEVAAAAGFVAEDGAGTAYHVEADDVLLALVPAHEAAEGVGGAPDAYYSCANE